MEVTIPPSLTDWDREDLMRILHEELRAIPEPKKPIGMNRIKEQSVWDRPNTAEEARDEQPVDRRRHQETHGDDCVLRAFRAAYKCALERYCGAEANDFHELESLVDHDRR